VVSNTSISLEDGLDHLPAQAIRVGKARREELGSLIEPLLVEFKAAEADTLAPAAGGENVFDVVGAVGRITGGGAYGGVESGRVSEEILGHTDEEAEDRGGEELEMDERADGEDRPAIDHGEEGEVRVARRGRG